MDKERKKRLQTWKIILTDALIVLSVVGLVTFLSFMAMGYKFNDDGELDQSGLLRVESLPTGATVTIDDEEMFLKTNMNHMLTEGEHQVRLTKEGYELWENQVEITSGRLYKLDYPRLFKQGRKAETALKFGDVAPEFISVSPDRKSLIYQISGETTWNLVNLNSDETEVTEIDVSGLAGVLTEVEWNEDGDKLLTKWDISGIIEYRLVDLRRPDQILSINSEFGLDFSKVRFLNASAEQLLALENGNLRRISVSAKEISRVLLSGLADFYNDKTNVLYVTTADEAGAREIGFYREGDASGVALMKTESEQIQLILDEYLGEKYIGVVLGSELKIYQGDYPRSALKKELEPSFSITLEFLPEEFMVRAEGRLLSLRGEGYVATFDAELSRISQFKLEGAGYFLDDFLVSEVNSEGELYAVDFDGTNRRRLAFKASSPAVISRNDKWLYYISSDGLKLKREEL